MVKRSWMVNALGVAALILSAAPKADALVVFDFNALNDGSSNADVDTYMQGVLTGNGGGNVAVTGSHGEQSYNGENFGTGPVVGSTVKTVYLGSSDGYFTGAPGSTQHLDTLDSFIRTDDNGGSERITMQFDFPIYQLSFDYEIFPDGSCPQAPCGSDFPDFKFEADDTQQFLTLGIIPGNAGTYPHSPNSGTVNNETAPQFIGVSGLYTFQGGVSKLAFIDWPRRIGIDNLQICTDSNECLPPPPPPVIPEPSSLLLMGSAMLGAFGVNRRRKS